MFCFRVNSDNLKVPGKTLLLFLVADSHKMMQSFRVLIGIDALWCCNLDCRIVLYNYGKFILNVHVSE